MSDASTFSLGGHSGLAEGSPFAIPSKKLGMWLFIISDAVTFGALLFAYGYLRNASTDWPAPFHFWPTMVNMMAMTFILVTSSLTMLVAVVAARQNDRDKAFRWILITAALGILFALLHIREWVSLIGEGLRPFQNPWGSSLFGGTFFAITGLHMTHVLIGAGILVAVALGYKRARYTSDDVEIWSLYWHFVDMVWMFVVPLVYLFNAAH